MKWSSILLATCCLWGQAKVPITHENVWMAKRVGSPALSPDGKRAVVSVADPSYDPSQQSADLWLLAVDGGAPPKRLTSTKAPEGDVAWSPDGSAIAFTTRREGDETPQIYVLKLDGGEAQRVTRLATGASGPVWRPDGKALLFQSEVFEGAKSEEDNARIAAERKARKYSARAWSSFPIARWDKWLSDTHSHVLVQELDSGSKPLDLLAKTKLAALPGYAARPTPDGGEDSQPVWSPDGNWIVFAASTDRDRGAYAQTTTHLYRVSTAGGEPEAITSGIDSFDDPKFSPDGRTLFASYERGGDQVLYSHSRIAKIEWPQLTKPQIIEANFDRPINAFRVGPDSRTIYLVGEEHGHDKIYTMPVSGGPVKPLSTIRTGTYASLDVAPRASAPVIVATWQSMQNPPEVVRVDARTGEHTFLTRFAGTELANVDLIPPREFWFTAKNGKRIHSFLVTPPAFQPSKKYPLLVFMHGGPHQAWKDQWFLRWNYHLLAAPGYVVLMTNYTGSPGYGEKFAADINSDVLRGPASEINEAADEALRQFPFIDATRQAAGGASYGGYLANWMEGNTTRYKCLFSHAGLTDNQSMWGTTDGAYYWELRYGGPVWDFQGQWHDQNPLKYAPNFKTPMLVTHGAADLRVPLGQGIEMFKLLQRQKVPSRLIVFPEENHWILRGENARYFFDELFGWLAKYL